MRRRADAKGTAVELLSVPSFGQGAFDGLCAYYTGAMMLTTLFPEFEPAFGQAMGRTTKLMSLDPLITHASGEDHRKVLARWFYNGETIKEVVRILNSIMRDYEFKTRFEYVEMTRRESTFDRIAASIDNGLPVIVGWDTEDYGCHAVLVIGYWVGKEKWLVTRDPGGDEDISWESLKAQQKGRGKFEVGVCKRHLGPRPMRAINSGDGPVVFHWTPEQEYQPLRDLFGEI